MSGNQTLVDMELLSYLYPMLTFLRRIRKGLLDGGRTSRYLLYAIGEIALVVIGILIALQINNWNEWRKERIKEKEILQELLETVDINLEVFQKSLWSIDRNIKSSEIILSVLETNPPYSDSLMQHFGRVLPIGWTAMEERTSQSGYKALESEGYAIIQNIELRAHVTQLFETSLPMIIKKSQEFGELYQQYWEETMRNYMYLDQGIHLVDYAKLLDDRYFRSMVEHRMRQKRRAYDLVSRIVNKTEATIELLNIELKEKE